MPCLPLFLSRAQNAVPLRQIITNEFELQFAIRESNIKAIESMDLARRTASWALARDVDSEWSYLLTRTEIKEKGVHYDSGSQAKSEDTKTQYTFKGPTDEVAKLMEIMAVIVCNVRKNALYIDQLSREIAKIETLALSNTNFSMERKNICEAQLTAASQTFTENVYTFKGYKEKIEALDYGVVEFTLQNKEEMLRKYFAFFAAQQAVDTNLMAEPVTTATTVQENLESKSSGLNSALML